MNFLKKIYLPFLLGIIFSVIFTFPAVLHLDNHVIGDGGDNYQYAGFQQLVAENIKNTKWPLANTNTWRYPVGFEFSRGFDSVLSNFFGASLLLLSNKPLISYNLTILSSFVFNFICAYLLFEEISESKKIATLGGIGFGFSFYNLARALGHANLLLTGGFALFTYALIKTIKKQNKKHIFFLGLSGILIALSSFQYLVMLAITIAIVIPILIIFYPKKFQQILVQAWKNKLIWILTTIASLILISPFVLPFAKAVDPLPI